MDPKSKSLRKGEFDWCLLPFRQNVPLPGDLNQWRALRRIQKVENFVWVPVIWMNNVAQRVVLVLDTSPTMPVFELWFIVSVS